MQADPDEIRRIVSEPDQVLFIKDYNDLEPLKKTIAKRMCESKYELW